MIGETVGSYVLQGTLGRGGMGEVYVGEHRMIDRKAAIKVLLRELCADPSVVERFFTEARATSRIHHPGIVDVLDCGLMPDGRAFIVMELLIGSSLRDFIARRGPMGPAEVAALGVQIANAVGAAHALKIVHRDLKPDNIFLTGGDPASALGRTVKILDFGIAKLIDPGASSSHTRTGALIGTPIYMSPEQCRGAGTIDHRTDVYALGCILFELLTGNPPFNKAGAGELIVAHLAEAPPTVRSVIAHVPPALDALVASLLAKSPDARPQSMADVEAALRPFLQSPTGLTGEMAGARAITQAAGLGSGPAAGVAGGTRILTPHPPGGQPKTTLGSTASQIGAGRRATTGGLADGDLDAPPATGKRGLLVAGALAALALAGGGGWALFGRGEAARTERPGASAAATTTATTGAAPSAAAPAPAPAAEAPRPAAAASATIVVDVEDRPAGTTIEVDGAPALLPVAVARTPGRSHTLRVTAPGHDTLVQGLAADAPERVTLRLTPSKDVVKSEKADAPHLPARRHERGTAAADAPVGGKPLDLDSLEDQPATSSHRRANAKANGKGKGRPPGAGDLDSLAE